MRPNRSGLVAVARYGVAVAGDGGVSEALIRDITTHAPCVVMLFGPPGAGKSTLATELAEGLGEPTAVLSYAAHREEVSGNPADPAADPSAGALLRTRLADRCAARQTTIVDGTHHLERSRRALLAIAAEAGLPAIAVVLTTPLPVCLDRQLDRPPPAPGTQHGLRIPDLQVREVHDALQDALPGLASEGFIVCTLDPASATPS